MWRLIYKAMQWEYFGRKEQAELDAKRTVVTQELRSHFSRTLPFSPSYLLEQIKHSRAQSDSLPGSPEDGQWAVNRWRKFQMTEQLKRHQTKLKKTVVSTPPSSCQNSLRRVSVKDAVCTRTKWRKFLTTEQIKQSRTKLKPLTRPVAELPLVDLDPYPMLLSGFAGEPPAASSRFHPKLPRWPVPRKKKTLT